MLYLLKEFLVFLVVRGDQAEEQLLQMQTDHVQTQQ